MLTLALALLTPVSIALQTATCALRPASSDFQPLPSLLGPQTSDLRPALFLSGGDVSEIPQVEAEGGKYFYKGKQQDPFVIMKKAGWNWVRFRIWNAPKDGWCDKARTLALARRAAAQGLAISLDFHYSDWWADPGKQNKPAVWKDLSFPNLAKAVYAYTYDVVSAMIAQGTPPNMVQIGNEIIGGMLWPDGKVSGEDEAQWEKLATLINAGVRGVRDAEPRIAHRALRIASPSIPTMLHIDRGGDNKASVWFFDHILKAGARFDCIGQSYYPFWHGTLPDLQANLNDLAKRYGKDLYIVETAYPFTLEHKRRSFVNEKNQLTPGFPATPEGQAAFLRKLKELLLAVPGGRGKGLLYWAPTWITGPKNTGGYPYENLATFDPAGKALPAVDALGVKSRQVGRD